MFLTVMGGLISCYVFWSWVCLELNVRKASQMGVPCVRIFIDGNNLPWMIVEPYIWRIVDALPLAWSSYPESLRFLRRGWHFREKAMAHSRHGPVWALVSPVKVNLHVSDPEAVEEILNRRKDFIRPSENYKILELFGPCISSVDLHNWPRHRKALAAPFNESIMGFVWAEALQQAREMALSWSHPKTTITGIKSVQKDTRSVSLNILAATAFRKSYKFHDSETENEATSYRAALQTVLDNSITLMLLPYWLLMMPMMPKSWKKIGQAGDRFKSYMVQMLDEETKAMKQGSQGSGGIMTSLVHALHIHQNDAVVGLPSNAGSSLAKGLSVEEIFGNLYVINFAGHDTTANSLAFSMFLLAGQPLVQQWVTEEIQEFAGNLSAEEWTYSLLFQKLHRCRAVLYETLRLYSPVIALPKGTDDRHQLLKVRNRSISILPHTDVTLSILACHTDPAVWTEPLAWKPSRWIIPASADAGESFSNPSKGTFLPWSDGPQSCPGKKFAEVEFVAILAYVLSNHRLEMKRHAGESEEKALERLSGTIEDIDMEMLLRMKDADRVRLVYKELQSR